MIAAFDLSDEDTVVTRMPAFDTMPWDSATCSPPGAFAGVRRGPVPSAAYLERIASRPEVPYIDWERARAIAVEPWNEAEACEP